jgi:O-antigen/teichoic acid export membrane protein
VVIGSSPRVGGLVPSFVRRFLGDADQRSLAAATLAGFVIRVTGVVLLTIVTVLFTRLMGAEEYGRLAFLLSGSFIIVLFAGLGLPTAASRLVPRYLARGDRDTALHYFLAGLAVVSVTGMVGAAALAALLRWLPSFVGEYDFSLAGILGLVITITLMRFVSEASRAFGLQLTGFVAESVAVRVILLAALALYLAAGAPLSAGTALGLYVLAQGLVVFAVVVMVLHQIAPSRSAVHLRPLRLYCGWLGISTVMLVTPVYYFLLFETDIIVLGVLAGPYDVGLYQVARRLAELTVFCAGAASAVGLPRLARAHAEGRADKLQATVDLMNLISVGSTAAVAVGLVAVGPFALQLFGRDFADGYPVLLILAFGRLAAALFGPASDVLLMTGHHRRLGRVNLVFALVNLALNLVLIPWLGAAGAAIATSTASLCWNIWLYVLVRRLTPTDTCALRRPWRKQCAAT